MGDTMRTFYIFKVNSMFKTLYDDKSNILYNIFKNINKSNNEDIINNFRLFERVTIPFNKKILNTYILLRHKDDLYYNHQNNNHTINSAFEVSKMTINTTYIKIKTNVNICSFLNDIIDTKEDVFVIDFDNNDYFWLNEIDTKTLV